jgi:hypothetical protein
VARQKYSSISLFMLTTNPQKLLRKLFFQNILQPKVILYEDSRQKVQSALIPPQHLPGMADQPHRGKYRLLDDKDHYASHKLPLLLSKLS